MPEPMDLQLFAGPHPTCCEFTAQLAAWGFVQRGERDVHTLFRAPNGGTIRVLRSQAGLADPDQVRKAARLAGITPARFWAGPPRVATAVPPQHPAPRRTRADRDTVTSLVLALHAEADRPLGFDQVVALSGDRVTRTQVSTASSALCRDGQLDRIRSGVYQWAAGQRAAQRNSQAPPGTRPVPSQLPLPQPGAASVTSLFRQLFPGGIQMTAEMFADLEQWARLTGKLASGRVTDTAG